MSDGKRVSADLTVCAIKTEVTVLLQERWAEHSDTNYSSTELMAL